jgi:hypothetical protein
MDQYPNQHPNGPFPNQPQGGLFTPEQCYWELRIQQLTQENAALQEKIFAANVRDMQQQKDIFKQGQNAFTVTNSLNGMTIAAQEQEGRVMGHKCRIWTLEEEQNMAKRECSEMEKKYLREIGTLKEDAELKAREFEELQIEGQEKSATIQRLQGELSEAMVAREKRKAQATESRKQPSEIRKHRALNVALGRRVRKLKNLVERLAGNIGSKNHQNNVLKAQRTFLQSEVTTLKSSYENAIAEGGGLRQNLESQAEEMEELETKLKGLESDNAAMSGQISDMEEKIALLEIAAKFAGRIRLRFLYAGNTGNSNRWFILDANRAAHDGNLVLDVALFSLGILDTSEQTWCEARYGCSIGTFIGSHAKLLPLLVSCNQTKFLNMHAYVEAELKQAEFKPDLRAKLQEPVSRFRALESECQDLLYSIRHGDHGDDGGDVDEETLEAFDEDDEDGRDIDEEVRKVFEEDPDIPSKIQKMEVIVGKITELGKPEKAQRRSHGRGDSM